MTLQTDVKKLRAIIRAMQDAYAQGKNAMAAARSILGQKSNDPMATLIAYDLQAGTYTAAKRRNSGFVNAKDVEVASFIKPLLPKHGSILEVGCGEATRLGGVTAALGDIVGESYGLDLSWSRINEGLRWLKEHNKSAGLFVGDLFNIPVNDNSIDVVYSSHSLEPNKGREEDAIRECLRVANVGVVLVEPIYELADADARKRMDRHGYVRGLKQSAEQVGAKVKEYRLLENIGNPLNPSGVLVLQKEERINEIPPASPRFWRCPLTGAPLEDLGDVLFADETGIAYPVIRGIPMLRPEHGIVASKLKHALL
jgi:ubiquinone/menaquinone biosynthesis C-methylase UbiE